MTRPARLSTSSTLSNRAASRSRPARLHRLLQRWNARRRRAARLTTGGAIGLGVLRACGWPRRGRAAARRWRRLRASLRARSWSARARCTSLKASITARGGSTRCKLHRHDLDAGVLGVERLLQQRAGFVGDLLALVGHRRLDRRAADDVAQRRLRPRPSPPSPVRRPEQELAGVADSPEHGAVGFDDVFVAGQHLPVPIRGPAPMRRPRARRARSG